MKVTFGIKVKAALGDSFDVAKRFVALAHDLGEQAGFVVAFFELAQADRFEADDPVEALDIAAAGGVEAPLGIGDGPRAVGEGDQTRQFIPRLG